MEMNMNNLEEYIRLNREAFDEQEVPEGHLLRFEERLETLRSAQGDSKVAQGDSTPEPPLATGRTQPQRSENGRGRDQVAGRKRPLIWLRFASVATGIAAAVAAVVIFINRPAERHKDWFAGVGNDQLEICQAYYGKMAEYYETILKGDFDGTRQFDLEAIAGEGIPLVDQLPDEIDPETRAAVLKEYYGALLDGMERLNTIY